VLTCTLLVALPACANKTKTPGAPAASGRLTVFAAASLTEAFGDVKTTLEAANKDLSIAYSFGGSGALVTQIQQGAPADVIATADEPSMQKLAAAGLIENPVVFAGNELEILVGVGNRKSINGLEDLARPDVLFVTEDDSVPAGKYTAQMLSGAGITAHPKSKELDVKAAVAKVITGEADATVVYVTDVLAAGGKAQGVVIPASQNVKARYVIARVKGATHRSAATAFYNWIVKGAGRAALTKRGFVGPS